MLARKDGHVGLTGIDERRCPPRRGLLQFPYAVVGLQTARSHYKLESGTLGNRNRSTG